MTARVPVAPRRVRVLGTTGSGKSTLAQALARRLGVPHLELDRLQHRPGWVPAPVAEFRGGLTSFLEAAPQGWVVDGNYQQQTDGLLDGADTVVWLDYTRRVVVSRVVRRTLARAITRRRLWNGNREPWNAILQRDPERNVVLWAWRTHPVNRQRYEAAMGPEWVRLRSPRATRAWLAGLPS